MPPNVVWIYPDELRASAVDDGDGVFSTIGYGLPESVVQPYRSFGPWADGSFRMPPIVSNRHRSPMRGGERPFRD